jgi:farnesyl-diphosphate farnesyltransferase
MEFSATPGGKLHLIAAIFPPWVLKNHVLLNGTIRFHLCLYVGVQGHDHPGSAPSRRPYLMLPRDAGAPRLCGSVRWCYPKKRFSLRSSTALCFNHLMVPFSSEMRNLLRQVARSFYITLRILPHSINAQVSIAYLLARASDTIADTRLVETAKRREALLQLRRSIQESCIGGMAKTPDLGELAAAQRAADQATLGEQVLLQNLGKVFRSLTEFPADDRLLIQNVLDTITRGQEMDLIRFGAASRDRLKALDTKEDLDEYTYQVAGCAGEFWTYMCRSHVFPNARLNDAMLLTNGIRFGKGLQLVNILRDLPKDLRQGRCYIPRQALSEHGLRPVDLLESAAMSRFRVLYDQYLRLAEEHLAAGWQYTTALPFGCLRIRLACAWPALIGMRTVALLRAGNVLDDRHRIKIGRAEIRQILLRSAILYPRRSAWNSLFSALASPRDGIFHFLND